MPDFIREYLPILIPIIILEIGLMVYSLRHVLKHDRYKFGRTTVRSIISSVSILQQQYPTFLPENIHSM